MFISRPIGPWFSATLHQFGLDLLSDKDLKDVHRNFYTEVPRRFWLLKVDLRCSFKHLASESCEPIISLSLLKLTKKSYSLSL